MAPLSTAPDIQQLPPNPIPVFYRGGERIAALRGNDAAALVSPEDWVGSTHAVGRAGVDPDTGISRLGDGSLVTSLIERDPERWLGDRPAMGYLLKLLNPSVRIPVHWHPDATFAGHHLGLPNGKAESWVVLGDAPTEVWLGFADSTKLSDIRRAVMAEDGDWMLAHMHHRTLLPGTTVYVPPGLAHAIAPGALLLELQEPSSLSVLAEHSCFDVGVHRATLGTDWDTVLTCLRPPESDPTIDALIGEVPSDPGTWPLLPPESLEFFSLRAVQVSGTTTVAIDGVTVALVDRGTLKLSGQTGDGSVAASAGSSWLVAAATATLTIEGTGSVFLSSAAPI